MFGEYDPLCPITIMTIIIIYLVKSKNIQFWCKNGSNLSTYSNYYWAYIFPYFVSSRAHSLANAIKFYEYLANVSVMIINCRYGSAVLYCFISFYESKWHIWKITIRWKQCCIKFDICAYTNWNFSPIFRSILRCASQKWNHITVSYAKQRCYMWGLTLFLVKCLLCIWLRAQ